MGKTRSLTELGLAAPGQPDVPIGGLALDSRDVRQGWLFAALPGTRVHGGEYIPYALRMGASAILTDRAGAALASGALSAARAERDVALVLAENPRQALAYAAALWHGAQPETIAAVTGTNGKTSVASFTRQLWEYLEIPGASLGTMGIEGAYSAPLEHTTPDPLTLHAHLAAMAAQGVDHLVLEASSHGIEQHRLDGVRLSAGAFTNLTQDHLDYHGTMDAYFEAKAELFRRLLPDGATAVINIDQEPGRIMAEIAAERGLRVLSMGRAPEADLRIHAQRLDETGQNLIISLRGERQMLRLDLIGGFQAENAMLAAGLALACGASQQAISGALEHLHGVRGRMQLAARRENGAPVFVDYAHTPDALRRALGALRPHVAGRLLVVVGAGGDRDRTKRKLMGQEAAAGADLVFVTDDNPRSEDPAAIRAMVMAGCPGAHEIPDRAEAILRAVDALQPGDALLIAGKGHETGQIIGDVTYPFDDAEQASVAVAALDGALP